MSRILLPQVFEDGSGFLVVEVIDIIEAFCRAFLELRCFQALCPKCIWLAAEYPCKNGHTYDKSIHCHTAFGAWLLPQRVGQRPEKTLGDVKFSYELRPTSTFPSPS